MIDKETTLTENYPVSYQRQWLILLALVVFIALSYFYKVHVYRPHVVPPPPAEARVGNWFYVLHMPEMQVHADTGSSRLQFSKWLDALQREGFYFMLLSDVVRELSQGAKLPEKTAVIVFDPGYRQTADTYVPLLKKRRIPGVWLTPAKALERDDKRYISRHQAQTLEASDLWDIGIYTPEGPVTLKAHGHETVLLGHRSPWKENAGRYAVNRGLSQNAFDRLNVNAKWTEQDLLHRLLVERPLHTSAVLSLQPIQGKTWGIGLDPTARESHFTLRAPAERRSGSLYWLGTLGLNDFHLHIEVKSLVGEMSVLLRSDLATGSGVTVIFGRGKVAIDQDVNFKTERLATVPCPDIKPYVPFNATLVVMGRQLALAVNSHPLVALASLAEPTSDQGMVRLLVQDSLKGTGEARSVRMIFTPLGKEK